MSKAPCDHCGKETRREYTGSVVWCSQCIDDNADALKALDLDGFYYCLGSGDWSFAVPENIKKLRTIPRKTQQNTVVAEVVVVKNTEPVAVQPAVKAEPKFDFETYNNVPLHKRR
jgi:hypothetical protein